MDDPETAKGGNANRKVAPLWQRGADDALGLDWTAKLSMKEPELSDDGINHDAIETLNSITPTNDQVLTPEERGL